MNGSAVKLGAKTDELRLVPGAYVIEREVTPSSCLLTSTCGEHHDIAMCAHAQTQTHANTK